jgi:hypothetical protein
VERTRRKLQSCRISTVPPLVAWTCLGSRKKSRKERGGRRQKWEREKEGGESREEGGESKEEKERRREKGGGRREGDSGRELREREERWERWGEGEEMMSAQYR